MAIVGSARNRATLRREHAGERILSAFAFATLQYYVRSIYYV